MSRPLSGVANGSPSTVRMGTFSTLNTRCWMRRPRGRLVGVVMGLSCLPGRPGQRRAERVGPPGQRYSARGFPGELDAGGVVDVDLGVLGQLIAVTGDPRWHQPTDVVHKHVQVTGPALGLLGDRRVGSDHGVVHGDELNPLMPGCPPEL